MTDRERFQKEHGAEWLRISSHPAFTAAMLLVNADTVQAVANLSDEEIQARGQIILADLRGRLSHENALIDLSIIHPDLSEDLPAATYPDPIAEAAAEEAADAQDVSTGGSLAEFFVPDITPPPQKKTTPKRRKRKNTT